MGRDVGTLRDGKVISVDPGTLPALDVEELTQESEAQLVARATAYAREYVRIEDHPTTLLKNIAAVAVALRIKLDDPKGQSYEYRVIMRDIYANAGVRKEVQNAVRYHIGNLLRRTLTTRELEKLGLLTTTPLERMQDSRAVDAKIIKAAKLATSAAEVVNLGDGSTGELVPAKAIKATADHLRLASTSASILNGLRPEIIDEHMTDGQRAKLDEELAAMQETLRRLRRHTRKRSSKA
ncbi:hypothetical protein ACWDX6_24125 [Streptomyces sp. NPDC003027]